VDGAKEEGDIVAGDCMAMCSVERKGVWRVVKNRKGGAGRKEGWGGRGGGRESKDKRERGRERDKGC